MERLNYRELAEKLDAIDKRLCEMGLSQYDRIRIHRQNLNELARASDEGTLEQIATDLSGDRRRQILWSFVEAIELVDAIDALDRQGCVVPKSVFQRILQGPPDVYLEDENSNLGRNTMFEIAIAGAAALAGSKPTLGGEPDVLFEFEDRRILVQCKRVLSERAVPKRIMNAAKQLTRDLSQSCDPRDCGLIAVSISRLINPGDQMLVVENEQSMSDALRNEIDGVFRQHQRVLQDVRLFTVAHSSNLYHLPGKSDATLLRNLAGRLRF